MWHIDPDDLEWRDCSNPHTMGVVTCDNPGPRVWNRWYYEARQLIGVQHHPHGGTRWDDTRVLCEGYTLTRRAAQRKVAAACGQMEREHDALTYQPDA